MLLAEFIFVSAPLLIEFFAEQYRQEDFAKTMDEWEANLGVPTINTYDFIVVGGGTAGCVVAARLSKQFSVLLLEAGGTPVPSTDAAAMPANVFPGINDIYSTVPQPHVSKSTGGVLSVSFGRMLGGSGSHNGMWHNRGSPYDFDNWANITGDPSWMYDNVLQYFKRSEDFRGDLVEEGDEDYYGHAGPLQVTTQKSNVLATWLEAGRELGYPIADANARQRRSFTPLTKLIYEGQRVSTYNRYVKPLEAVQANLTVVRYAVVHELMLDENNKAYGVEYKRHGIVQRAYVRNEIIVSAGVVRSPLLLMKSGIGPVDVLADAEIPLKLERAGVGQNVMDHMSCNVNPIYVNDSSILTKIYEGDEEVLERYHTTRDGILADSGGGPQAFLISDRAVADGQADWPDIRMSPSFSRTPAPEGQSESFGMGFEFGRPKSRGTIRLNGTAWKGGEREDTRLAVIDPRFLNDESDMEVILYGIKVALQIFEETSAFQRYGATLSRQVPFPECEAYEFRSEEYWRCYVLWRTPNFYHMTGSNKMGRVDDLFAVVDSKLRVIGATGLRVIDASVMPIISNSNTNAAVIMIAEKGADDILKDYGGEGPTTTTTTTTAEPPEGEDSHGVRVRGILDPILLLLCSFCFRFI